MFSKTAKNFVTATVDAKTGCPADGDYRQDTATSRNGRVNSKAVAPLAVTAALGLVLSAGR